MRLLILLTLFSLYSCCHCPDIKEVKPSSAVKKEGIVVEAIQRGVYEYVNIVEVKLINYTKSDFQFITMSGATAINVVTNSSDVSFFIPPCSSNYPIEINLKPNQEFSIVLALKNGFRNGNVKFGIIVNHDPSKDLSQMRKKMENVVWSKPIELKSTSFRFFEIRNIINDSTYSIIDHQR